jgi:hypothetical protein
MALPSRDFIAEFNAHTSQLSLRIHELQRR